MNWVIEILGGPNNAQAAGSIFSAITALFAVIVARNTAKHAKFSICPAFSAWGEYEVRRKEGVPTISCTVTLSNKGFGPAIINGFNAFIGNKEISVDSFTDIEKLFNEALVDQCIKIEKTGLPERGHAFGMNESCTIVRFDVIVTDDVIPSSHSETLSSLKHISIAISYRDIYDRRWVFWIQEFKGYTYRQSKLHHSYWKARWSLGKIVDEI